MEAPEGEQRQMFSYIDPSVQDELNRDGKLVSLNKDGLALPHSGGRPFMQLVGPVPLPIYLEQGPQVFRWYAGVRRSDLERIEHVVAQVRQKGPRGLFALLSDHMAVNSVLVYGDFAEAEAPLVRVHSNCLTGDVFGSLRCDCGPQLHAALEQLVKEGVGALTYMAGHEGRGIGLWAKAITYLLQDAGHDTYEANERLGLPADSRDFSDAGRMLVYLRGGKRRLRLLGNNPKKRAALEAAGLKIVAQEPLVAGVNPYNVRYLGSKRAHGHLIPAESLAGQEPAGPLLEPRRK
jgi:GTP cyclohydrolase II